MAAIDIYDPTVNNRALPGVIILFVILGFLASLLVTIRLYTRLWVKSTSGWDDWLIIPALVRKMMHSNNFRSLGLRLTKLYQDICMGLVRHNRCANLWRWLRTTFRNLQHAPSGRH